MSFWKRKRPKTECYVTAQLNARLQPLDRDRFEDPLHAVLKKQGLGEVTGGGTMMAEEPAGIEYCDVEIVLNEASDENLNLVLRELERLGAPKGSKLHVTGERIISFGTYEGMAMFLNGIDLPEDVYQTCDVDHVIDESNRLIAISGAGEYYSYWRGSKETGLYFYGHSFDQMATAVQPLLDNYPLCSGARIEQIA